MVKTLELGGYSTLGCQIKLKIRSAPTSRNAMNSWFIASKCWPNSLFQTSTEDGKRKTKLFWHRQANSWSELLEITSSPDASSTVLGIKALNSSASMVKHEFWRRLSSEFFCFFHIFCFSSQTSSCVVLLIKSPEQNWLAWHRSSSASGSMGSSTPATLASSSQ